MAKLISQKTDRKQQGYVLVSMLALVTVMGGLAASMYSDVASQEKMSSSLSMKKRVLSAADSAVQSVWNVNELLGSAGTDHTAVRTINKDADYDTTYKNLNVSATVCFGGNGDSGFGGNDLDADDSSDVGGFGFFIFTAYGDATNTVSGAASRIAMGGFMQGPLVSLPAVTPCP